MFNNFLKYTLPSAEYSTVPIKFLLAMREQQNNSFSFLISPIKVPTPFGLYFANNGKNFLALILKKSPSNINSSL